jgi:predicted nucleic acid-binding protein
MGALVLDASVILAFVNPTDALSGTVRYALGQARTHEHTFIMPASVLAESLVWTARDRPDRLDDLVMRLITLFGDERVVARDVAVATARLRARHRSLRLPDALVLATGVVDDAGVLTCDQRLAQLDPRIQVLAP